MALKAWITLALLALSVLPATPASAKSFESRLHFTDPEGDVRIGNPNLANRTAPAGTYDHIDVLAVWFEPKDETSLEFGLKVKQGAEPPGLAQTLSRRFEFRFNFGTMVYNLAAPAFGCQARITGSENGTGPARYRCLKAEIDTATGTVRATVPRVFVLDEKGIPFQPGSTIEKFRVHAFAGTQTGVLLAYVGMPVWGYDEAPDVESRSFYEPTGYESEGGALSMRALDTIRASNGESTTMVFEVFLTNAGDAQQSVLLSHESAEPSFQVRTPSRLVVDAGKTVAFPVILSMGFTHRHGEIATFLVHATSATDERERSTIALSVYWLETPQPAGHHDKMWLHSAPLDQNPFWPLLELQKNWFNPVEEPDPSEEPTARSFVTQNGAYLWSFLLEPMLGIGLDFDLEREGTFRGELMTRLPHATAVLNVTLYHCDPTGKRPGQRVSYCSGVSTISPAAYGESPARSMTPGSFVPFEARLKADPGADVLPFQKNANLVLMLSLRTDGPQQPGFVPGPRPEVRTRGAELALPLNEYHDPIDQAFRSVGSLRIEPLDPFEKHVNPGRRAVFAFELVNEGETAQRVALGVEGHNREWARVVGEPEVELAPGGNATVELVVEVPVDASPGERGELFLVAESTSNPNVVAISRLRASVVDPAVEDVPDEAPSAGFASKGWVPGVDAVGILAALGAAMLIFRRSGRRRV